MLRPLAVTAAVLTVATLAQASADDATPQRQHASASRDLSSPHRDDGRGIGFTPGPAADGRLGFTPDRRVTRGPSALTPPMNPPPARAVATHTVEAPPPAPIAHASATRNAAAPQETPPQPVTPPATPAAVEPPSATAPVASATREPPQVSARVVTHPAAEMPPPEPVHPDACHLDGEVQRVSIDPGPLRAVQIALASHGDDAVALVVMGRSPPPRQIRQGMVFPEARLIRVGREGEPIVQHAPGFEPDAALALGDHGEVAVVNHSRFDVHGDVLSSRPTVRVSVLDADGHLVGAPQALEGSAGLRIDSPVVAVRDGYAVVLGRETSADDGRRGPVHESLFAIESHGSGWRAPLLVTDAQGDDSIGRYRVGLHASDGGRAITASWTVAGGHDAGVWVRSVRNDSLEAPHRLVARAAWGSEITPDGDGVLYRSGGERDAPVQLFYVPTRSGAPVVLGAGWDPSVAWVAGRLLVAGATLADRNGRELNALIATAAPGTTLSALDAPAGSGDALATAVDYDLVPTAHGAVLAWIESDADESAASRRVAIARVACR